MLLTLNTLLSTILNLFGSSIFLDFRFLKNAVSGYVYYPIVENDQLIMCYVPCKYKKKMEEFYKKLSKIVPLDSISLQEIND